MIQEVAVFSLTWAKTWQVLYSTLNFSQCQQKPFILFIHLLIINNNCIFHVAILKYLVLKISYFILIHWKNIYTIKKNYYISMTWQPYEGQGNQLTAELRFVSQKTELYYHSVSIMWYVDKQQFLDGNYHNNSWSCWAGTKPILTNSMAYGTPKFNAAFTKSLQQSLSYWYLFI